jgi:hypothetical protein
LLSEYHGGLYGGHRGEKSMFETMKKRFYWPGMFVACRELCKTCEACQRGSNLRYEEEMRLRQDRVVNKSIQVDVTHLPNGVGGMTCIVHGVCTVSGFHKARALVNWKKESIIKFLEERYLCEEGPIVIEKIIGDNGELASPEVRAALKTMGVDVVLSTSYHPQSQGVVERGHSVLISALRKYCAGKPGLWPRKLKYAVMAINISVKRTTGVSPYYMVYGVEPSLPMEFTVPYINSATEFMTTEELVQLRLQQLDVFEIRKGEAIARLEKAKEMWKGYFDRTKRLRPEDKKVKEGDLVLVFDSTIGRQKDKKLDFRWFGPFKVVKVREGGSYRLADLDGNEFNRDHAGNRVKKFFSRLIEGDQLQVGLFFSP